MMIKRGQVSIFVIISLVIAGSAVVFFLFKDNVLTSDKIPRGMEKEVGEVNQQIQNCLNKRAVDAIRIVGVQGGYIYLPENYVNTNISNVAYGYYLGKKTLPTLAFIESEIATYARRNLFFCISQESNPSLNLNFGESSAKAKINKNSVVVSVKLPVSGKKENSAFTMNREYKVEVPVALGDMYSVADEIIEKEIKEPGVVQISYLTGLGYNVLLISISQDLIVYSITDYSEKSRIEDIPYSFVFANKFRSGNGE